MSLGKYSKTFVAIIGVILTYASQHYGTSVVVKDVILIATVLGVYAVPNVTNTPSK